MRHLERHFAGVNIYGKFAHRGFYRSVLGHSPVHLQCGWELRNGCRPIGGGTGFTPYPAVGRVVGIFSGALRAPWKIKHNNCSVLVSHETLEVISEIRTSENLESARKYASKAVAELSRTPFTAAGINVKYSSSDPITPEVAALVECPMDGLITDGGFAIGSRQSTRSLEFEDGVLNLTAIFKEGMSTIEFNFHKKSSVAEELQEWLSLPKEKIDDAVSTILTKFNLK